MGAQFLRWRPARVLDGRGDPIRNALVEIWPCDQHGVYQRIQDPKARKSVTIPFEAMAGSRAGELTARFEIVLGVTPEA